MKKIEAIIREERLEPVQWALAESGYHGMTVSEVCGRGRQEGISLQWRAGEYRVDFLPKLKIEVVTLDQDVAIIVNTIANKARTGEVGDGKIFVIPVEDAVRIRTGESGFNAV